LDDISSRPPKGPYIPSIQLLKSIKDHVPQDKCESRLH
jgi:hypothetical protein